MADLDASTTDMNSTAKYGSIVPRTLYVGMGLHKPKKHVKFDQLYKSEKVTQL